jgi:hypothetical protein
MQIAAINELSADRARFSLEGSPLQVMEINFLDHKALRDARVGDYLVEYENGYLSRSPAKAFEEGYTLIDSVVDEKPETKSPFKWPDDQAELDMKARAAEQAALAGQDAKDAAAQKHTMGTLAASATHEKHHGKEHKK